MSGQPDATAVLVSLWRALHAERDAPIVYEDRIGLELIDPPADWREQPTMGEEFSRPFRSLMVGRARLVDDVIAAAVERGVGQYVLLGAGIDTFALRCPPALAERLTIFEIDQPDTQGWKRLRLRETGRPEPANVRYVAVDFETGQSWVDEIGKAGFDADRPAVVSALGVTQYITESATSEMLRSVAGLAPGTVFVCGFNPPTEALPVEDRPVIESILAMVAARGCPWIGRYTGAQFRALAHLCGFARTEVVDGTELGRRYFAGRGDGLLPTVAEEFLVAHVD